MRVFRLFLIGSSLVCLLVLGGAVMAQEEGATEPTAQSLADLVREGWNTDDAALLEQTYAPDAVHRSIYNDGVFEADGRDAIIAVAMNSATVTPVAPLVELDAPAGSLHWVTFGDVIASRFAGKGSVCNFWAQDGMITRHDCLVPMDCPVGMCTP